MTVIFQPYTKNNLDFHPDIDIVMFDGFGSDSEAIEEPDFVLNVPSLPVVSESAPEPERRAGACTPPHSTPGTHDVIKSPVYRRGVSTRARYQAEHMTQAEIDRKNRDLKQKERERKKFEKEQRRQERLDRQRDKKEKEAGKAKKRGRKPKVPRDYPNMNEKERTKKKEARKDSKVDLDFKLWISKMLFFNNISYIICEFEFYNIIYIIQIILY